MSEISYPRVTIEFCTQCKWNLRAAYFAQELLQTFSTSIGEIALIPSTGGVFVVKMQYRTGSSTSENENAEVKTAILWDRKAEGGFPEPKELKRRVRDIIQPGRDLGHVDGHKKSTKAGEAAVDASKEAKDETKKVCEDCR